MSELNKHDEAMQMEYLLTLDNSEDHSVLIQKYMPFILKQVSLALGRYVQSENEEALIVGMEAFEEAIHKYEPLKGTFINFAALVIKSRVLDYLKRENRIHSHEIATDPFSLTQLETESTNDFKTDLEDEVTQFGETLNTFEITMNELVDESPVHTRTRNDLINLCHKLSEDQDLIEKLMMKKQLPMAEITLKYQVSKKILKTHRKFIIACLIIYYDGLEHLKPYINPRGDQNV